MGKKASTSVTLLSSPSNANIIGHHVGFVEGGAMSGSELHTTSFTIGCFNVRSLADVPLLWLSFPKFNNTTSHRELFQASCQVRVLRKFMDLGRQQVVFLVGIRRCVFLSLILSVFFLFQEDKVGWWCGSDSVFV